jgi:hypothetical protein
MKAGGAQQGGHRDGSDGSDGFIQAEERVMNLYSLMLFLHVCGDIGIFIGIGAQLLGLMALRRTTRVEQARAIAGLMSLSDPISIVSALVTIAAGLYLALTVWGLQTGWIAVALVSLIVLLPPLMAGVVEPRMRAIVTMAKEAPDGPLPATLDARIHDPLLGTALQTVVAVVLGIVFLMTNKPPLAGSVAAMVVALALGLASGLPLWRNAHTFRTGL